MTVATTSPAISTDDARRLTERIRYCAISVRDGMEKLQNLVAEAQSSNVHLVLGYKSWTAYLADTLGDEPMRLPRDERREVVAWLAGEGMSTRAIAPVVGAGFKTVARDLEVARVSTDTRAHNTTPTDADLITGTDWSPEPDADPITGEVIEPERTVTGMDGKTYTAPASKPRRPALADQFRNASLALAQKVEAIERLVADDRFTQNAEKVATANRSDLLRAIDALQRVVAKL